MPSVDVNSAPFRPTSPKPIPVRCSDPAGRFVQAIASANTSQSIGLAGYGNRDYGTVRNKGVLVTVRNGCMLTITHVLEVRMNK